MDAHKMCIRDSALTILLWAALIVPCAAAAFRRLHDTGRSGLWILSVLLQMCIRDSTGASHSA